MDPRFPASFEGRLDVRTLPWRRRARYRCRSGRPPPRPRTARARSSAVISETSAQPSTATKPSRASMPTATRPGCVLARRYAPDRGVAQRHRAQDHPPRSRPFRARRSIGGPGRGCRRPTRPSARFPRPVPPSPASAFTGRPSKAPLRSTMCSHRYSRPAAKTRAWAAGSVVEDGHCGPCRPAPGARNLPSLRSIAGRNFISVSKSSLCSARLRPPVQEVGDQPPGLRPLALSRDGTVCRSMLSRPIIAVTGPP